MLCGMCRLLYLIQKTHTCVLQAVAIKLMISSTESGGVGVRGRKAQAHERERERDGVNIIGIREERRDCARENSV